MSVFGFGIQRRFQCGVELQRDGAHVRVWAPAASRVDFVHLHPAGERRHRLDRESDGHHSGSVPGVAAGDRYWLALDDDRLRPDPRSRYQPDGPHGPSAVVDPAAFAWTDGQWRGLARAGNVLYEMHVGTFTPEGTWRAAAEHLPALADLGITAIEMMPVSDFPGRFGWGYDGVNLYAPTRLYGTPDDLRAFIDRAHALGLGVILDVVYNHLGPDGNYLAEFSPEYFTDKYTNDWGQPINFEGPTAVREFFIENAAYWISEFHFDGLRIDATQDMHDASREHVLASIATRARAAAGRRGVLLVAENEPQQARLVRPVEQGGYGLDAMWNDDFHHTAVVALTGRREAYYHDYKGSVQELLSCAKFGFLYQGQYYAWQKKRRGTPALDLPRSTFVTYLENHDQVANTPYGRRLHAITAPGRYRALTALLLLAPGTPMLFQGQEYGASSPFLYFADHKRELQEPVASGRRAFLSQFPSIRDPDVQASLPPPSAEETFRRSTLDPGERQRGLDMVALHRDLLAIRCGDPVIGGPAPRVDGAAAEEAEQEGLGGQRGAGDRLLLVNLGCDLDLVPCPEPLLAPPAEAGWRLLWSSESVRYGGQGTPPIHAEGQWRLAGETAVLLTSERGTPHEHHQ